MNGFDALYEKAKDRVRALSELPSTKAGSIEEMLEDRGIERRDFMKWAAGITAMQESSSNVITWIAASGSSPLKRN